MPEYSRMLRDLRGDLKKRVASGRSVSATYSLKDFIQRHHALPFMRIETNYSESDLPQLRIRIEAFLEMIDNKSVIRTRISL